MWEGAVLLLTDLTDGEPEGTSDAHDHCLLPLPRLAVYWDHVVRRLDLHLCLQYEGKEEGVVSGLVIVKDTPSKKRGKKGDISRTQHRLHVVVKRTLLQFFMILVGLTVCTPSSPSN